MRRYPFFLLLALVVAGMLLIAGCGGGDESGGSGSGEDLYKDNCATCHGTDGGGGIGKDLQGVADRLTLEEHLEVVREGKGTMPAWKNSLSAEEIDAVVEYERTELSG